MSQTGAENINGIGELVQRRENVNLALKRVVQIVVAIYNERLNPGSSEHLSLNVDNLSFAERASRLGVLNEIAYRLMDNAGPELQARARRLQELSERVNVFISDLTRTESEESEKPEPTLASLATDYEGEPEAIEGQELSLRREGVVLTTTEQNRNKRLELLTRIIHNPEGLTVEEFTQIIGETSHKHLDDLGIEANYERAVNMITVYSGKGGFLKR